MPVRFGVDVLLDQLERPGAPARRGRAGLVTNDAARLAAEGTHYSRSALIDAGLPIQRLFGPEHGLVATEADGAAVHDRVDGRTGLPVVSLYGARMRPAPDHLADLDVMLFDIPDIGARCYTYAWTLFHVLHACAEAGLPVVVLDRPNPLGGCAHAAEGPVLTEACRSFLGEDDIPLRHSLTLGELARLWQQEHLPGVSLEVIPCEEWERKRAWPAVGRPWVPTSPAMPHFECAIWYTGTCLFEATNLSVGRGTDRPFAQVGAPWLDAAALIEMVEAEASDAGAVLSACHFTPAEGPNVGTGCHGVRVLSRASDDDASWIAQHTSPVRLGLALLDAIVRLHPTQFQWAVYPTAANPSGADHFARLIGRADLRDRVGHLTPAERHAITQVSAWRERTASARLY
ncbi:MAG TPA: DUF1343 domain-containing protein [Gemmatimonas aurantiaca]|uniref:DUF1343 domain-containing protein n=2 Tax=Gemmatimonas aurantiaca TaxID=173480 RepID=C1A675_GEMAT|nr:DUF1343 domain-containing protein [Gemmatimonas aurantiaca]BAH37735.1 hypothetical protein GAU_0693 [Gemmatimonas aurantiaca T-27]HCT58770.1 DUF1343 domain-containing protein [Gemmatimonas aurantiaca]